jgi:hypothetical protein
MCAAEPEHRKFCSQWSHPRGTDTLAGLMEWVGSIALLVPFIIGPAEEFPSGSHHALINHAGRNLGFPGNVAYESTWRGSPACWRLKIGVGMSLRSMLL